MSSENPMRSRVQHTRLAGRSVAAGLAKLDTMCNAGSTCVEVQASPLATSALDALKTAVASARTSFSAMLAAATALRAASKALRIDFGAAADALRIYEASVAALAGGNAAIISGAGLLARTPAARLALGTVTAVKGAPGKRPAEAILTWPAAKGAKGYAIEVSFTPESPDPTWTALAQGSGRRRVVKAPAPRAQLLARIAAVAADGTRSGWSTPILVTAR